MTDFARQLKEFLDQHVASDMSVEELTRLFFDTHTLPEINSHEDLEREVAAVTDLINQANFQDVMAKLGI